MGGGGCRVMSMTAVMVMMIVVHVLFVLANG